MHDDNPDDRQQERRTRPTHGTLRPTSEAMDRIAREYLEQHPHDTSDKEQGQ